LNDQSTIAADLAVQRIPRVISKVTEAARRNYPFSKYFFNFDDIFLKFYHDVYQVGLLIPIKQ
jgi:hypothetical protein